MELNFSTGSQHPITVDHVKRVAKKYKKSEGITHTQALEAAAKSLGYQNWIDCQRQLKEG